MTVEEIYYKAKEDHRNAHESIEAIFDQELIDAIDDLVVFSVNHNVSLKELFSGKYDPQFEATIEVIFKGRGNTCKSGLICWNTVRQVEKEYITAAYNFVVASNNL